MEALREPRQAARLVTAVGGLGFIVFFVAAATVYAGGAGRFSAEIIAYYSQPSNRLAQVTGFAILMVGLALLMAFVAGLRTVATRTEPWSSLMYGSGVAMVLCLVVANTLWASSAFTTMIEPSYQIDPKSHLLFEDSGFAFLIAGGVMGAAFVGTTSVGAALDRLWPAWLSWLGIPVGAALLAVYWYLPLFAFLVWMALVSVVALRCAPPRRRPEGDS